MDEVDITHIKENSLEHLCRVCVPTDRTDDPD